MRPVAPEVKTVEQPVQLLNAEYDHIVGDVRRGFEPLGFEALEPETEAVALPIKYFYPITRAIEKDEKHWIEHGYLDIQLDQGGQAVDGFSEVDGLGVEIDFFDFGVGSHHELLAPEGIGITASGIIWSL